MAVDRLMGILAVLLREEQVTARDLASRFEVSVRTIQRDVDRLCQAGIPLRTLRGAGGGVSIMEGYSLDRTALTDADRGAILAGLRGLDSVSGGGYYRQLMERLPSSRTQAGDDCVVIDLASWYGPLLAPRLELLKSACADRRAVRFTYCAPGGDSVRTVEPCRLVFRWSGWYLFGRCRLREDFRLFKLTRMLDLEVLEETFPAYPLPSPITPVDRVYPDRITGVIRFRPSARWRLIDEYGGGSFTVESDGSLLFTRGFPDGEELVRWVLTFGDQAELVEPRELRDRLTKTLRNILSKYDR